MGTPLHHRKADLSGEGEGPGVLPEEEEVGRVTGKPEGFSAWSKMHGYFMYRREEFLAHYHQRSNVETTFSMIKRKFGDSLRSKTDTAQKNETLAKVLCHNLVVLIHEACELGIAANFWASETPAHQSPA